MAVTQSGTSVAGGGHPPRRTIRFQGIWLWTAIAALFVAVAAIVVGSLASAYQPLSMWNEFGGFPGTHLPVGERMVNDFGGQTGELYIPHQRGTFVAMVSLRNYGPYAITIEAVAIRPPHEGFPQALAPAGPALYWTSRMTDLPDRGRPIAGFVLKPGDGIYVAAPVRTPRCYIPRAFQIVKYFYAEMRFGPFTKWVRIPLSTPLLLNLPAEPPKPAQGVVCSG